MQMLKKLVVNDATLANIFHGTKALREFLTNPVFTDDRGLSDLAYDVIREVYGNPERGDFPNISSMAPFFARNQNVLWDLLVKKGIIAKYQDNRKPVRTSSYKEWSKLNHLS
jgi:hypothetical protein